MTSNQIAWAEARRKQEADAETRRANAAQESLTWQEILRKVGADAETARSNLARETETQRSNLEKENQNLLNILQSAYDAAQNREFAYLGQLLSAAIGASKSPLGAISGPLIAESGILGYQLGNPAENNIYVNSPAFQQGLKYGDVAIPTLGSGSGKGTSSYSKDSGYSYGAMKVR